MNIWTDPPTRTYPNFQGGTVYQWGHWRVGETVLCVYMLKDIPPYLVHFECGYHLDHKKKPYLGGEMISKVELSTIELELLEGLSERSRVQQFRLAQQTPV